MRNERTDTVTVVTCRAEVWENNSGTTGVKSDVRGRAAWHRTAEGSWSADERERLIAELREVGTAR